MNRIKTKRTPTRRLKTTRNATSVKLIAFSMFVKITVKNITYYLFSNIHRARKQRITRACSADRAAHFRYVYRTIRPFR
jgi:hypothetical protein